MKSPTPSITQFKIQHSFIYSTIHHPSLHLSTNFFIHAFTNPLIQLLIISFIDSSILSLIYFFIHFIHSKTVPLSPHMYPAIKLSIWPSIKSSSFHPLNAPSTHSVLYTRTKKGITAVPALEKLTIKWWKQTATTLEVKGSSRQVPSQKETQVLLGIQRRLLGGSSIQ